MALKAAENLTGQVASDTQSRPPVPDQAQPKPGLPSDAKKYKMRSMGTDMAKSKDINAPKPKPLSDKTNIKEQDAPKRIQDLKLNAIKPPSGPITIKPLKPLGAPQPKNPIKNRYLSPNPTPPSTPPRPEVTPKPSIAPAKSGMPPKELPTPETPQTRPAPKTTPVSPENKKSVDIDKILEDYKKSAVKKPLHTGAPPRKAVQQKTTIPPQGFKRERITLPPLEESLKSTKKPFASKLFKTKGGSRKIIALSTIAGAIILFIVGEIWWFFIRPTPEIEAPPIEEILPPPEEVIVLPKEDPIILAPEIPPGLLSHNRVIELESDSAEPAAIGASIKELTEEPFEENILARIIVIVPEDNNLKLLSLNNLITALGISIPSSITDNLQEDYDLFFLSETNNVDPRLGLAIKTNGSTTLNQSLVSWEDTMVQNLTPLILNIPTINNGNFLNANYRGVDIRYRNLPTDSTTIDYAHITNTLIITTSKELMFKAIDAL